MDVFVCVGLWGGVLVGGGGDVYVWGRGGVMVFGGEVYMCVVCLVGEVCVYVSVSLWWGRCVCVLRVLGRGVCVCVSLRVYMWSTIYKNMCIPVCPDPINYITTYCINIRKNVHQTSKINENNITDKQKQAATEARQPNREEGRRWNPLLRVTKY